MMCLPAAVGLARPPGGAGDPYFSNVAALLHMDGAEGSTTFTDVTGKIWTPAGGAEIDTAASKFGGASGKFGAPGARISTPAHADFAFGTGAFTIEWWQLWVNLTNYQNAFSMGYGLSGGVFLQANTVGKYTLYAGPATVICTESVDHASGADWVHYEVSRDDLGTARIFRNGVLRGSGAMPQNITGAHDFYFGGEASGSYSVRGQLDDCRVTKGVARHVANFTPPTAPYPDA